MNIEHLDKGARMLLDELYPKSIGKVKSSNITFEFDVHYQTNYLKLSSNTFSVSVLQGT